MIRRVDAPRSLRRLTKEELVQIVNGGTFAQAHEARAELQRRAVVRNVLALSLAIAVALLAGIVFVATAVIT